jgi:hypothetical protein
MADLPLSEIQLLRRLESVVSPFTCTPWPPLLANQLFEYLAVYPNLAG